MDPKQKTDYQALARSELAFEYREITTGVDTSESGAEMFAKALNRRTQELYLLDKKD